MSPDAKSASTTALIVGEDSASAEEGTGVRTHVLLVVAMAVLIAIITSLSLLLIRHGLETQIIDNLSQGLDQSVVTFRDLQEERFNRLQRENALLAALPTLKALMTSGDQLTIQNGAVEFWQLSGTDLFALADSSGHVVAAYTKGDAVDGALRQSLESLLVSPKTRYLIHGRALYTCALRPLYFGSDEDGTLLGYVISGSSVERSVRQIGQPGDVEALFLNDGHILAGTLNSSTDKNIPWQLQSLLDGQTAAQPVKLDGTRYLIASRDFTSIASSPLRLVVLKSFEPADRWLARINRLILVTGLFVLLVGTVLMVVLSRSVTKPLEELSHSVRAFGVGDGSYRVPRYGTQEVRHLSSAFAGMRNEIQGANQALLESERLATIGRMASSVSHDLRHYLATVYANAEFLASDRLSAAERAEIFADIRAAVHGTTDMIESLLIFSRSGAIVSREPELMATLLERAAALIRRHPDATGVTIETHYDDPTETAVLADGKQMERAVYNLLLNACQATRAAGVSPIVSVSLKPENELMIMDVTDNGIGVPGKIRDRLFEPFVSEGKQKGTGLGLTLVQCIAVDHGGDVQLLQGEGGKTVFRMTLVRDLAEQAAASSGDEGHRMGANINVRA